VLIAKAGAANYGHTLSDILPKLVNIGRAGFTAVRLLLPDTMQMFGGLIGDVLAELGVRTLEIEWVAAATLREAEDVYVFSPVALHNTRKSTTFLELHDVLARIYDVRFSASRRFYLRRSEAERRKMANAAEVDAVFARRGFEPVYPPDLPLQQQIHLFAAASHIAGGLGAGLANIGFAPPECEVVMIDPGLGDFYFWDFACLMGQRFNWVFSGPLAGYSTELAQGDYTVGLGALDAALGALLG
jgi:capsular polysaccharide biosynthesis protein